MKNGDVIWNLVDSKRSAFEALSDRVWAMPEIAYTRSTSPAPNIHPCYARKDSTLPNALPVFRRQ